VRLPKLTTRERAAWEKIRVLDDADLYALMGQEPRYEIARSTPEHLLVGLEFRKTRQAIARGKGRIEDVCRTCRSEICKRWDSLRKYKKKKDKAVAVALVCEVIARVLKADPNVPIVAVGELVCRTCGFSLDKFCNVSPSE